MTYVIKEYFRTIQGEGFHTGTPALFIRFAGCNMWSGKEGHRIRDARLNNAQCPKWCDTDFNGGMRMSREEIVGIVHANPVPLVVLSGGEPMLQLDEDLMDDLCDIGPTIAIETNGTVKPKFTGLPRRRLWITLSPKRPRSETVLLRASELKLVVPDYSRGEWEDFPAEHYYAQPRANGTIRDTLNEKATASLITREGGKWKLSLQTHKILGVP